MIIIERRDPFGVDRVFLFLPFCHSLRFLNSCTTLHSSQACSHIFCLSFQLLAEQNSASMKRHQLVAFDPSDLAHVAELRRQRLVSPIHVPIDIILKQIPSSYVAGELTG